MTMIVAATVIMKTTATATPPITAPLSVTDDESDHKK